MNGRAAVLAPLLAAFLTDCAMSLTVREAIECSEEGDDEEPDVVELREKRDDNG